MYQDCSLDIVLGYHIDGKLAICENLVNIILISNFICYD